MVTVEVYNSIEELFSGFLNLFYLCLLSLFCVPVPLFGSVVYVSSPQMTYHRCLHCNYNYGGCPLTEQL